jgi:hypothetical protein
MFEGHRVTLSHLVGKTQRDIVAPWSRLKCDTCNFVSFPATVAPFDWERV